MLFPIQPLQSGLRVNSDDLKQLGSHVKKYSVVSIICGRDGGLYTPNHTCSDFSNKEEGGGGSLSMNGRTGLTNFSSFKFRYFRIPGFASNVEMMI